MFNTDAMCTKGTSMNDDIVYYLLLVAAAKQKHIKESLNLLVFAKKTR